MGGARLHNNAIMHIIGRGNTYYSARDIVRLFVIYDYLPKYLLEKMFRIWRQKTYVIGNWSLLNGVRECDSEPDSEYASE